MMRFAESSNAVLSFAACFFYRIAWAGIAEWNLHCGILAHIAVLPRTVKNAGWQPALRVAWRQSAKLAGDSGLVLG
jgi:hypothetical protein